MYKYHFHKPNVEFQKKYPSANQGLVFSSYRLQMYTWALRLGPLRRMQLSNAYTLRREYSVEWGVCRRRNNESGRRLEVSRGNVRGEIGSRGETGEGCERESEERMREAR
jgi:hypothetical protein